MLSKTGGAEETQYHHLLLFYLEKFKGHLSAITKFLQFILVSVEFRLRSITMVLFFGHYVIKLRRLGISAVLYAEYFPNKAIASSGSNVVDLLDQRTGARYGWFNFDVEGSVVIVR